MNTVLIHNLRCISLWKACENKDRMNDTLNFDLHQQKKGMCSQTLKHKTNLRQVTVLFLLPFEE